MTTEGLVAGRFAVLSAREDRAQRHTIPGVIPPVRENSLRGLSLLPEFGLS